MSDKQEYYYAVALDAQAQEATHGDYPGADAIAALEVKAQPEPERRCETCRFWDAWEDEWGNPRDRGECYLEEEEDSPVEIIVRGSGDEWVTTEYITPASFHCAGWQQRPPSSGA